MSDSSEGEIISFSVPTMTGGGCPLLYEDGLSRRAPATGEEMARGFSAGPGAPPAGTFWNEDSSSSCPATDAANRAKSSGGGGSSRRTTVSYVINEASPGLLQAAESGALQSLKEACEAVGADLQTLHFGKLDFGETSVLDRFYNAAAFSCKPSQGDAEQQRSTAKTERRESLNKTYAKLMLGSSAIFATATKCTHVHKEVQNAEKKLLPNAC